MIVIKLGGSLSQSDALGRCLRHLQTNYQGRDVVIVPGGGAFAEQVRLAQRQLGFDDRTAHYMAILAMQQMALLMHALLPGTQLVHTVGDIRRQKAGFGLQVWSPDYRELDLAGIPASWDISSDSLAAWLATTIVAKELVVVKAAAVDPQLSLQQLAKQGIIDAGFCGYASSAPFKLRLLSQQQFLAIQ